MRLSHGPIAALVQRGLRALGSGEPTRTICSTLVAQAFQSVRYPILPTRREVPCRGPVRAHRDDCVEVAWEPRH